MNLFKLVNWQLEVDEVAWGLEPFHKLLVRDKSKGKERALKDMLFIYYFADIRSDYLYITDENQRIKSICKDMNLPSKWKIDATLQTAIDLYIERSTTVIRKLYQAASKSADAVALHLSNTKALLKERDDRGKPVHTINTITAALKQVPTIMKDLKEAEKQVIKEKNDVSGKQKGAKTFGMFEEGLD